MNRSKSKKVALLLVLTLIGVLAIGYFSVIAQGSTDSLSKYQQQQSQIDKELAAKKAELKKAKANLSNYQSQLRGVDYSISASEQKLAALSAQLKSAQRELDVTNKELKKSQEALSVQLQAFETRIRESYINGDVSLIDVFFDATSMEDFITRSYYMEKMLQYDADMMDTINGRIDDISEKRAAQTKKTNNLASLKKSQQDITNQLAQERKSKAALVTSAANAKEESEEAYSDVLAEANAISAEIRRIQAELAASGQGGQGTGILGWPISSSHRSISSPYGMRRHPVTGVYKLHTGTDFPAPSGTPIYAADDGVVILARYNGAYGNCVIIDHGKGMSTLYAHMSRVGTSNGASVKKGSVIGYVGTTGSSTGNHLHFEVRKNGSYQNPMGYL